MVASCATLLEERVERDEFSGAFLLAEHGVPLIERAYGYASKGHGARNHVDTLFNIGSMTKMFTAIAIATLVERGMLRFDDVVNSILPEYPPEVGEKVSIHHLLTHTSGMGSYWNASFEAARTSLRSVSDYMPLFVDDPLAFSPGERFLYSNAGFVLLGAIIERLSGVSYDAYLREHVFDRACMTDTCAWELAVDVPNRAVGYVRDETDNTSNEHASTNVLVSSIKGSPAGGTYSTVFDLLRFAHALRTDQLLSPEFTRLVLEPRVPMGQHGDASYAYGFGCHDVGGTRIIGHNGGAPGVGAQLDLYMESGYTVALLSNYGPRVIMQLAQPMRQLLSGQ